MLTRFKNCNVCGKRNLQKQIWFCDRCGNCRKCCRCNLRKPKTMEEAFAMPKHWRIVKQRRKIGGPYFLQTGTYGAAQAWTGGQLSSGSSKAVWVTDYEIDFPTRAAAIEYLKTVPDSWGNKTLLIKETQ